MKYKIITTIQKLNAITNYISQLAEQVIGEDYAKSQSKTNRTLITLNQSQIMKLIRLKEIDTLRLQIKGLQLHDLYCD